MIAKTDLARLYETVLSIPGMNEKIKLDLKLPLRNALLLSKVIERGLMGKDADDSIPNLLDLVSPELTQELLGISAEILQKTGLMEMNEKLKKMGEK
jgi:hypothetical protein